MKRNNRGQFVGKKIPRRAIRVLGVKRDSVVAKNFGVHRWSVAQWRKKFGIKSALKQWSFEYEKCKKCKLTKRKHRWRGYCIKCWTKSPEYKKVSLENYYRNKLKVKLYRQKFYIKNREKLLKQTQEYKIKNKVRYSENYPRIYWKNRFKLIFEFKLPCALCGSKKINILETHHKVSIKRAKKLKWKKAKIHSIKNLLVICNQCHRLGEYAIHSITNNK